MFAKRAFNPLVTYTILLRSEFHTQQHCSFRGPHISTHTSETVSERDLRATDRQYSLRTPCSSPVIANYPALLRLSCASIGLFLNFRTHFRT